VNEGVVLPKGGDEVFEITKEGGWFAYKSEERQEGKTMRTLHEGKQKGDQHEE